MIPGRHDDRYGLGFYGMLASDDFKDQPILGDALDDEWGMEAFYNIALTPWMQLSGSVQYIEPGVASIDHSTVIATRLQINF